MIGVKSKTKLSTDRFPILYSKGRALCLSLQVKVVVTINGDHETAACTWMNRTWFKAHFFILSTLLCSTLNVCQSDFPMTCIFPRMWCVPVTSPVVRLCITGLPSHITCLPSQITSLHSYTTSLHSYMYDFRACLVVQIWRVLSENEVWRVNNMASAITWHIIVYIMIPPMRVG